MVRITSVNKVNLTKEKQLLNGVSLNVYSRFANYNDK